MNNEKYLSLDIFDEILSKEFNKSVLELKEYIKELRILLTDELIKNFFEFKLKEENPGLRQRILNRKFITKRDTNIIKQELQDDLDIKKYIYNGKTLKYYENYISSLKNKINSLFALVNSLQLNDENRTINVEKYDISMDENNKISQIDVIRIIEPLIYNIKLLERLVFRANTLQYYFDNQISKENNVEDISMIDLKSKDEINCENRDLSSKILKIK